MELFSWLLLLPALVFSKKNDPLNPFKSGFDLKREINHLILLWWYDRAMKMPTDLQSDSKRVLMVGSNSCQNKISHINIYIYIWLVVLKINFIFHNIWDNPSHWRTHICLKMVTHILGNSWSQLTFTPSFFRGVGSTTNQIYIYYITISYLVNHCRYRLTIKHIY